MSSPHPVVDLPTLESLNVSQEQIDSVKSDDNKVKSIINQWLSTFSQAIATKDVSAVLAHLQPDAFWRDLLALTWDLRTFFGRDDKIKKFVTEQVFTTGFSDLRIIGGEGVNPVFQQLFPDLAWIQFFVSFKVTVGEGKAIIRLVPTSTPNSSNGPLTWKAHTIYTALESLAGHPENLGPLRNQNPNHGLWPAQRQREIDFLDREPAVVIVGGGQSGLDVAARLKVLGVDTLILERNSEVGQQWKNRYEALCLHDPVWYDHMPYIPFPASWPVYSPAPKLSAWLKSYAESMELNAWTSSAPNSIRYNSAGKHWEVDVTRGGGEGPAYGKRTVRPRRVVFALGIASNQPNMPTFKGQENFKGKIMHSLSYGTAKDYIGKKALVIGACTSAHDIAADFYTNSVPVTMYQRSSSYIMTTKSGWAVSFAGTYVEGGPPSDIADLLTASYPNEFAKQIQKRTTQIIKDLDRNIIDGLHRVGFNTNDGINGTGFAQLAWEKAGGYYLDVGTSQLIIDKKIGLVSNTGFSHFTENSAVFEDGREVPCDVVICATGLGDARGPIEDIIGSELGSNLKPIWGLDSEGEMKSIWKGTGLEDLWVMMGNLALCRFHSKTIALQIKAKEAGLWDGKRYSS